jgi:protein tyrosine/serine phosphatase
MNVNPSQKYTVVNRKRVFIAASVVIAGILVCGWFGFARDRVIPKKFGVVVSDRIYRSGQISSTLIKKVLTQYKIRVIVNLNSPEAGDPDKQAEEQAAKDLNIKVLRFPLSGKGTGDVNNYAGALTAIADAEKQGLPVLVHCSAGAQRTGGVIAAYRLLVQKKDPAFVIGEMKHYGWNSKDNPQLVPYINSNMVQLSVLLKQAGVITEIPDPLPVLYENGS